jgi:hypothetical protein
MSTVAKILVVVNLVLAGAFLASAASFLGNEDHWKAKYEGSVDKYTDMIEGDRVLGPDNKPVTPIQRKGGLNARIAELTAERNNLADQVNKIRTTLAQSEEQRNLVTAQKDLLKTSNDSLGASLTSATRALDAAQSTLDSNRRMIDGLQAERQALKDALTAANEQKDAAKRMAASLEVSLGAETENRKGLEAQLADCAEKVRRLEFELETWRSKFPGADVPTGQPSHEGKVLAADNGANVFVISLGEEDGVKPGFKYIVSRGSSYVTTIEITDVEAKKSAGRSLKDMQKSPVKPGDVVLTK